MIWLKNKGKRIHLFFLPQKNELKSIFIQNAFVFSLLIGATSFSLAQEEIPETEAGEEKEFHRHKISLIIGHAHIPAGFSNGEKRMLVVPSWGLDYNFLINKKWAIGLHSDFYTENFTVIDFGGNEELERERPIALTLVGSYYLDEKWSVIAGTGYEFAKEENLPIVRFGLERAWELPENWEFMATIQYDLRIGVFNSWMIGLGVIKSF